MKRRQKFNAQPTEIVHKGKVVKCASKFEAKKLHELILLLRAGEIRHLEFHPRYPLTVNGRKICDYVADAEFEEGPDGKLVVYEAKGSETPAWKIKRKLFEALYAYELRVVKA